MPISGTTNDYLLSAWDIDLEKAGEIVSLNSSLGDEAKAEAKQDSFSQLDSAKNVPDYKPREQNNILSNDIFSSSRGEDDEYIEEKMKPHMDDIKDAMKNQDEDALKDILGQIKDEMQKDLEEGKFINNHSDGPEKGDLSAEDFQKATEEALKAQEDALQGLMQKANGGMGGGSPGGGFDGDDLIRQARIDKWEALKDQQMVYYLKATLAGIKASQTLAKSVS